MDLPKHGRYDYSPIIERPDYSWPGGKRLAFYVALNVEHFAFGSGMGHTPTEPAPAPDARNYAWRDYGLRVGVWRIEHRLDRVARACLARAAGYRQEVQVVVAQDRLGRGTESAHAAHHRQ